ncbi:DNA polymerase I [Nocardioides sp. Kera G14]|uniref:DNA polymerase I n=1 Tax=Nocardioides sp. Kera G14 TaxID=2884264 RepID=UPI001D125BD9|nr:DNA polymerase I [Nocardioides sp. Kera G14]UDY22429.1 DNA polymerase I [Nocardioides sp. Kera G14]
MSGATRPRLLLLDGHSLAYRAFFALPVENFATAAGQHTNAVYGFTSMLTNVLRDEQPTHVAVAFDVSRQTFRMAEYSEYKAKRNKTPDEFKSQLPLIKQLLDTWRIPFLEVDGYEADDIIATLVTEALAEDFDVLVLTGDRDSLQLVTEHSTILYPMRGVSDLARMTPAAVQEKYGVPPARYPEIAALVGEDSDNLPGVPGVGPKTAAKWIAQFDGLDNIITRVDEIKGKAGDNLRAHLGDVIRNRRLNALVCDLPLAKRPEELVRAEWDRQAALQFLDELEIRGELRTRVMTVVGDAGAAEEPTAEGGFELAGRTLSPGEVGAFLASLGTTPVALHVRGSWGSGTGQVDGLAFVTHEEAAYLSLETAAPEDLAALGAWLGDPERPKLMHDAKGPAQALWGQGEWDLLGLQTDTALAAYLVAPDQRSYDLADLTLRYLKRELKSEVSTDQGALFDDPAEDAGQAAMLHARAVLDLAEALDGEVERAGGTRLLTGIEQPLIGVLARMERTGIAVDQDHLEDLMGFFADEVRGAAEAAYDVIGKEINLGSPKQLQVVLFDELDMPKTKKTKTGYTTDADALQWLYEATEHPFMLHLLRHREAQKLRVTIEGLLKTVQPDGRIHTTFNQTVAATGRLSSNEPNLQNIPIRTEEGRRIREGFVVGAGFESLMTADYSQIEMRIMADLSGDEQLIEAFKSGQDFHTITARRVFGIPDDVLVTSEQRAKIKAMNYGLAYGLSAFGLSQQLGIEPSEARGLMEEYFQTFGGIRDYLAEVVAEARRSGYTETIMGRRRFLPDLTSDNRQRREMAERMALNAPIQGSAADLIKVAMLNTQRALESEGLASRLLLQVHDELVLEVAPGERDRLEELIRREMGGAADLTVPLDVSVGTGRSWHDAAH